VYTVAQKGRGTLNPPPFAHLRALDILQLNRDLLESSTQILLETEVLDGDQLQAILAQVQVSAGLHSWLAKS